MTLSRITPWLKGATSVGFFVVLVRVVSGPSLMGQLRSADGRWVAVSVGLSFVMIAVSCWKWWMLLRHQHHPLPFRTLLRFYFIGYYFTCLLPSNVGGDVVRSYYAGRSMGSQQHAAVSVVLERVTGLVLLLGLTVIGPFGIEGALRHPAFAAPAAAAAALLLVMGWTGVRSAAMNGDSSTAPRPRGQASAPRGVMAWPAVQRVVERFEGKARGVNEKLTTSVRSFGHAPGAAAAVLGLSAAFYGLACLNVFVSFRAFQTPVPFLAVLAVLPTAMLVAMLPIAPLAGLGLAEGAYVFYFGFVGMEPSASLAMGLLLRCKLLLVGTIGWLLQMTLPGRGRFRGAGPGAPIAACRDGTMERN